MGIKTPLLLSEANSLFRNYTFSKLLSTSSGIVDTTYIADKYIIKKYERDVNVAFDVKLLQHLQELNVSRYITSSRSKKESWHLYSKLEGSEVKHVKLFHIQALARFLAKFHRLTKSYPCQVNFLKQYQIDSKLQKLRRLSFLHYKKLHYLQSLQLKNDGFIHGDLFKDNTLFEGNTIAVFDFIDGGEGNFLFDCAVALVGFDKRELYLNTFLRSYNQCAPKKIEKEKLKEMLQVASGFYALLRVAHYKNLKKAKELL